MVAQGRKRARRGPGRGAGPDTLRGPPRAARPGRLRGALLRRSFRCRGTLRRARGGQVRLHPGLQRLADPGHGHGLRLRAPAPALLHRPGPGQGRAYARRV
eukprot:3946025-Pyramimonas_sp.AAC.1